MTKKQERINHFFRAMSSMGISDEDAAALRRIEMTLHRWSEHECNGNIQREGEDGEGRPRWHYGFDLPGGKDRSYPIPDRERGALKRLSRIMAKYPALTAYHQTDPRGCALYILRPQDLTGYDGKKYQPDQVYNRGVMVGY